MSDLDLKELWYSEPEKAPPTMNVAEVQSKASAFETKIKRRNILEWLACVVVVGLHAHDAFDSANALILTGNLIVVFAGLFITMVLWRKGRVSLDADPALDSVGFMHAHANSLDAQAKLLARVPLWYLSPIAIGLGFLFAGRYPSDGQPSMGWLLTVTFVALVFVGIAWMNLRAARKMRNDARALRSDLNGHP